MSPRGTVHPLPALLRFHLRVGVRVALRAAAPLVALPIAAIGLSPEPARWPADMGRLLLLPRVDPLVPLVATVLALGLSAWAARRMDLSAGGWTRHLPAGEADHRRAGILGLAAAQLPLGLVLAVLWLGALVAGEPVQWIVPVSWLAASAAAASALWPSRRRPWLAPVAIAGAFLGFSGNGAGLGAALVALLAVDRLGGPVERASRRSLPMEATRGSLHLKITLRALGWRLVWAQVTPALTLAVTALVVRNNAVPSGGSAMAARLGSTLALAFLMTELSHLLAVRRPHWPWARSLPEGAAARIGRDLLLLSCLAIPMIVAAAWIDPVAALGALALAPVLALVAAREIRSASASRSLIPARVFAAGFFVTLLHGLLWWLPLVALPALPLLNRAAVSRDRTTPVTLWREGGHLAAGDSLSWSDR